MSTKVSSAGKSAKKSREAKSENTEVVASKRSSKSKSQSKSLLSAPKTKHSARSNELDEPSASMLQVTSEKSMRSKAQRKNKAAASVPAKEITPEEEAEETVFGFDSDDADSSDEEEDLNGDDIVLEGIDIQKLPTIAKDDATVRRKLEKAKRRPTDDMGVIYIGRLPHGFYEDQLRGYFSQFGTVTRLRLSRNKKTGASKHYAFLEFDSSSVAKIVVETMDNYLLMGHILQCKFIPTSEVHPQLWIGANKKWKVIPRSRIERLQFGKERDDDMKFQAEQRLLRRQEAKKRKIKEAGIDYDFDDVAYLKKAKVASEIVV